MSACIALQASRCLYARPELIVARRRSARFMCAPQEEVSPILLLERQRLLMEQVGISAIGIATTTHKLKLEELAALRGVDPGKYTQGLGCDEMSLCGPDEDAASLAVKAAQDALEMWGGDPAQIGLLIVGTETAADMSRPLSAWVAQGLGLKGAFRSYEVKHACYGGTAAVRQATEWLASGAARGRVALVVATDVALYAPKDPGEPTQGAGAVAMVLSERPRIASVELDSYAFSMPVFDFWRPVGERFPRVEGKFSLECYKEAAYECFKAWSDQEGVSALEGLSAVCFHSPFPKMVKKAFAHVATQLGLSEAQAQAYDEAKIEPDLAWGRRTGNTYTASVWYGLAHALCRLEDGARVGVFSYGSGAGAELMFVKVCEGNPLDAQWAKRVEDALDARQALDARAYDKLRGA